jgi:hypothetical protein
MRGDTAKKITIAGLCSWYSVLNQQRTRYVFYLIIGFLVPWDKTGLLLVVWWRMQSLLFALSAQFLCVGDFKCSKRKTTTKLFTQTVIIKAIFVYYKICISFCGNSLRRRQCLFVLCNVNMAGKWSVATTQWWKLVVYLPSVRLKQISLQAYSRPKREFRLYMNLELWDLLLMSMVWDYAFELQPPTGLLFIS